MQKDKPVADEPHIAGYAVRRDERWPQAETKGAASSRRHRPNRRIDLPGLRAQTLAVNSRLGQTRTATPRERTDRHAGRSVTAPDRRRPSIAGRLVPVRNDSTARSDQNCADQS